MDYALSDYELGYNQAELMSLCNFYEHSRLGAVIRMLKDRVLEQRSYLKIIRFSYGKRGGSKLDRVKGIIERLARGRNGIVCVQDFRSIHSAIKKKYELTSYHYDYLTCIQHIEYWHPIPTHEAVVCKCCGDLFLEPIVKSELRSRFSLCGDRCGYVMRIHARMTDAYRFQSAIKSETVSARYKADVRKGKLPLLCFVDYLTKQQRKKGLSKNKGKFTW